jgi:hypothetical protein
MISDLRRAIAVATALLVTLLALGRVRVSWTGGAGAPAGAEDPGCAAVTRSLGPKARPPLAGREPAAALAAERDGACPQAVRRALPA